MDLLSLVDGNWVDVCSVISGFSYIAYKRKTLPVKARTYPIISRRTGLDFGNGVALFPLIVLVLSAISSQALDSLTDSNPVTLASAGVLGVLAILEE